jgi:hypothetical protein
MQQPPGNLLLHGFFVPVRVSVPEVRRKHFVRRDPEVKSNPQPILGPLLPQDLGHGFIQHFHLPRIQSPYHVRTSFPALFDQQHRQSYANGLGCAKNDSGAHPM